MPEVHLFRAALRDLLRVKRLGIPIALIFLPAVLAAVWRANDPGGFQSEQAYDALATSLIFGFVLVILAVILGAGVLSQEVEGKTIVFLLTRPLARWRLLLARYGAHLAVIVAASWISVALLALSAYGPDLARAPVVRDCTILLVGAVAYSALVLLASTVIRRVTLFGLLFAFGWESWAPDAPGAFRQLSLMAYLRVLAPHIPPASSTSEASKIARVVAPLEISNIRAWEVLLAASALMIFVALYLFSVREYVPRDDAA